MRPFDRNADVVDFAFIIPASDQIAQYISVDLTAGIGRVFWWQFAVTKYTALTLLTGLDQLILSSRACSSSYV